MVLTQFKPRSYSYHHAIPDSVLLNKQDDQHDTLRVQEMFNKGFHGEEEEQPTRSRSKALDIVRGLNKRSSYGRGYKSREEREEEELAAAKAAEERE